jgi:hypothetical protein
MGRRMHSGRARALARPDNHHNCLAGKRSEVGNAKSAWRAIKEAGGVVGQVVVMRALIVAVGRVLAYRLLALGLSACVMVVSAAPAQAYDAETSPWDQCVVSSGANMGVLEYTLRPSDKATIEAGSQVTFTGESKSPVTFAVASSPALLSSPDIDGGPGSVQTRTSPSTYTFTSTRVTAAPRTVYWTASFSSTGLAECAGLSATTYTTSVRTLTVLPNVALQEREAREAWERREATEREAAERRKTAEQEAAARRCVVPSLKGDSLSKARRVLGRAHCRLGAVSSPRGHARGPLIVTRQSPRAGSWPAGGARVMVTLGRPGARGRR